MLLEQTRSNKNFSYIRKKQYLCTRKSSNMPKMGCKGFLCFLTQNDIFLHIYLHKWEKYRTFASELVTTDSFAPCETHNLFTDESIIVNISLATYNMETIGNTSVRTSVCTAFAFVSIGYARHLFTKKRKQYFYLRSLTYWITVKNIKSSELFAFIFFLL